MKLDFPIINKYIDLSNPVSEQDIERFEKMMNVKLPLSFVSLKKEIADCLYINSGNALEIFSLFDSNSSTFSIAGISSNYAHLGDILKSHKLLIFGISSVDSETWAFYTGGKYSNGEYPVIWISPSEERFFVHSSNFESFLNIQFHSLTSLNEGADYDKLYKDLVAKYDNDILPFGYNDIYSSSHDLEDFESIIKQY
ncbi:MAG: SMI1/KNR4 family protein [Bacteroidales bacterium]